MLPRLASSSTPAIRAPTGRHSAPARTAAAHPAPRTRLGRAHSLARALGTQTGGSRRGRSSPAQSSERTPRRKVRAVNERRHHTPTLFFLRRRGGGGRGDTVANSSQMSFDAEARGLLCFQSMKSPALPPPFFSSSRRCPGRCSQCTLIFGHGAKTRDGGKGWV